jgi:hypothetical protein
MAKAPESVQDAVMDVGRMKAFLKLTQTGDDDGGKVRLPIVVGLDNADEGVVSVAKRGSPKKLRADLIKIVQKQGLAGQMKTDPSRLYFGYAYTNDDAEGVLQIDVNKQPAGVDKLANKIFRRVRSAGFSEVVFHVNEGLENVSEEDDAPDAPPAAPPAQPQAQTQATETKPEPDATADAARAALSRDLAAAIGGVAAAAGADAARKAALVKLAGAANAAMKGGDLAQAARLVAELKAAIDKGPATGGQTAIPPDKLLALFRDAKDDVDSGLNKLQEALRATGDADLLRIAEYGLYGMTDGAGVGLMKALFNLQAAKPDTRDALYAAARAAAEAYRTAVFADEAVDLVDNNPFGVEVGIKSKLGPALDAIANAA